MKRGLDADALRSAADSGDPLELADLGLRFDLTVPLARFYATHRGELPTVFRAIQIGPVWRAERPQKGRYRQFVQCDIDIIGEAGPLAEAELVTATAATLDALGLEGATMRINDRRLLASVLDDPRLPVRRARRGAHHDRQARQGGTGRASSPSCASVEPRHPTAVDALEEFFRRPKTMEWLPFGEAAIRKSLPEGVDPIAVAELASIGLAVEAARGGSVDGAGQPLVQFDPFLVRGMGYYTGTIFELAHPSRRLLARRRRPLRRHDRPLPRAATFPRSGSRSASSASSNWSTSWMTRPPTPPRSCTTPTADPAALVALQSRLIAAGARVRLERRPKNVAPLLQQLADAGFARYASVGADVTADDELDFRPLNRDTSRE